MDSPEPKVTTKALLRELLLESIPHAWFDFGGACVFFFLAGQIGSFTHGWAEGMTGIHDWLSYFREWRWGFVGSFFYMLIMGHISIRRKSLQEIKGLKADQDKTAQEIADLRRQATGDDYKRRISIALISEITGLKMRANGGDANSLFTIGSVPFADWVKDCDYVLTKYCGENSYYHNVFSGVSRDAVVEQRLVQELARQGIMSGRPLTRVISGDGREITYKIVCLDWIISQFLPFTIQKDVDTSVT